jgi:hypothetical protein
MNKNKLDYKTITVTLEDCNGLQIISTYVFPKYRTKRRISRRFKEMEKDPIKWFEKVLYWE